MGRFSKSRDGNESEIVAALVAAGATVQPIEGTGKGVAGESSGCPDLLVGYQGRTYLIEVKNPATKNNNGQSYVPRAALALGGEFEGMHPKLRLGQARWHKAWQGEPPHTVETPGQALIAIGAAP